MNTRINTPSRGSPTYYRRPKSVSFAVIAAAVSLVGAVFGGAWKASAATTAWLDHHYVSREVYERHLFADSVSHEASRRVRLAQQAVLDSIARHENPQPGRVLQAGMTR